MRSCGCANINFVLVSLQVSKCRVFSVCVLNCHLDGFPGIVMERRTYKVQAYLTINGLTTYLGGQGPEYKVTGIYALVHIFEFLLYF